MILLAIPALISGALALYTWRLRRMAGVTPFSVMMFILFEWGMSYILELAGTEIRTKIFWETVKFAGVVATPVAWLIFAFEYTGRKAWINARRLAMLSILPLTTFLIILTNDSHGLFRVKRELSFEGGFLLLRTTDGPWFWVHAAYTYILIMVGLALIVRALLRWPAQYRGQMVWILLSTLTPLIANAITIFQILPIQIDLTSYAFTVTGVGMAYALFRHRMLDIAPIARDIIIDGMKDGMIVLDANRRVVDINQAAQKMIGLSGERGPIGKPVGDVLSQWPELVEHYRDVTEAEDEVSIGEGEDQRWYELNLSTLYDENKLVIGRVITAHDITDRKQTQEALRIARDQALEASLAKSQLLSKVSHELRTPLGGIVGYAELLQGKAFGEINERQQKAAREILESADYLTNMVNELLDEAQMRAGTSILAEKTFSPYALIQQTASGMDILAQKKDLAFSVSIDPSLPQEIHGDDRRIRQIIINLVGNAIKFTKEGSVHLIVSHPDPDYWGIQVTDTGVGIPKEAQPHIFEPFRQVNSAVTRDNRGVGLGLSITKQLVELMRGRIVVQSELGKGSTFTVLLPIIKGAEQK
jgi:PAS domain S-box-containing protein